MSASAEKQLVKHLKEAHALEKQAIQLLEQGAKIAGDEEIGAIYRAHLMQTREHERYVSERLEALGEEPSRARDLAAQGGALAIAATLRAASDTPVRLAAAAFAFENLEIASYRLLHGLAERAGDSDTAAVTERILEQEEAAAELVAGTFERALEHTLGEDPTSPLPGVTPIGKPSERDDDLSTPHHGPQGNKGRATDAPVRQDAGVPTADQVGSPAPGYPADDTRPWGGEPADLRHPEDIRPPGQ